MLLLGSAGEVTIELDTYRQAQSEYEVLTQAVTAQPAPVQVTPVTTTEESGESPINKTKTVDFTALSAQNEDTIGWLSQDGSGIDYPIVQGGDNAFYLSHSFSKAESKAGCIFADVGCAGDFSGRVTVLYGHDLLDGSMLSSLNRYRSQSYFDEHETLTLFTPNETLTVRIFAAFEADPAEYETDTSPWRTAFASDTDFARWLENQQERTLIATKVTPSESDRILVLSTCTGLSGRFLVLGTLE